MKNSIAALLMLLPLMISAQEKELKDVFSVELRNKGAIISESQVTGYYMFYKDDEVKEDVFNYELLILDQNLNELFSKSIEGNESLILNECVYNGRELLIDIVDLEKEESIYKRYNQSTQEIETKRKDLSAYDLQVAKMMHSSDASTNAQFKYPVDNQGFAYYKSKPDGRKITPEIHFISSINDKGNWVYESSKKQKKDMVMAGHLYADENILIASLWKSEMVVAGRSGKKTDTYVLGLNAENGDELFETKLDNEKFNYQTVSAEYNTSNNTTRLYGVYRSSDESLVTGSGSLGLFIITIDKKGKIINRKHISWIEHINSKIPDEKNKITEQRFPQVSSIKKLSSGKTYVIAEQVEFYKQKRQEMFEVGDLMVIELNKTDELSSVKIIEKEPNAGAIPDLGSRSVNRSLDKNKNGMIGVLYGGGQFGFKDAHLNKNKTELTILYTSFTGDKNKNTCVVGVIALGANEIEKNELTLSNVTDRKHFDLLKAKTGNICIFQYFEDKKSIQWTLEKMK